jgi:hypothetical protein
MMNPGLAKSADWRRRRQTGRPARLSVSEERPTMGAALLVQSGGAVFAPHRVLERGAASGFMTFGPRGGQSIGVPSAL